jgi:hypothetical protein
MSLLLTNLKHFSVTFVLLLAAVVCFGLFIGADAHLFEDKLAYQLDGEVQVFYQDNQTVTLRIKGDNESGFAVEQQALAATSNNSIKVQFPADNSSFTLNIDKLPSTPDAIYNDAEPIVAISDIESGFSAFRHFLVSHGVADKELNWTFGRGHLVLLGDFVDRGASTSQVLWGIYKLEQSARRSGGKVHFILGNHEIKNLQGNFQSAHEKYFYIAGILGKQQFQLFDDNSVLGRWLASKNVLEVINAVAFVHGGLHPDLAKYQLAVSEINQIVRSGHRTLYYTPPVVTEESFLRSSTTGPAWYRGYFKDDLSEEEIAQGLKAVNAKAVVVGHTLQSEVKALYNNKVFAIDVKHPKDYLTSFPLRASEGLLIKNGLYFRLFDDGSRQAL